MIGFKNQEQIIDKVVADLVAPDHAQSWNVAVPPGFGEDAFITKVVEGIQHAEPKPLLAEVTSDSVRDVQDYIRRLHRQWNEDDALGPLPDNLHDSELFDTLLASLPEDRPVVQVIRRFHTMLDRFEVWLLGKLRDAEQNNKIRTFTATPISLYDLKVRWESEGHILVVSNYGDTHKEEMVQVLDEDAVLLAVESMDIPPDIAGHLCALTGGYPESFALLIDEWLRNGRQPLTPELRKHLKSIATKSLLPFVKGLDRKGGPPVNRDSVVDLHLGFDTDTTVQRLLSHPWKDILFDNDYGLRAECVGDAAVHVAIRTTAVGQKSEHVRLERELRARHTYLQRQYDVALKMLEHDGYLESARPDLAILCANTRVMRSLYQGESLDEDANWGVVINHIESAQETTERFKDKVENASFLTARLSELKEIVGSLANVITKRDVRLVDVLGGLSDPERCQHKVAVVLMLVKYESCRVIPGHSSACQEGIYLPEQILRLWAFWRLGINYYKVPDGCDEIWDEAEAHWPNERGEFVRAAPGKSFPNLFTFGYFVLAKLLLEQPENFDDAPFSDFPSLESRLKKYTQFRNPKAHSYSRTSKKDRTAFFDQIDEWLDCLVAVCPEVENRDALLGMIEPLPVVDREGVFVYEETG